MAVWQATNVLTGTIENPKYVEIGIITEIWKVALGTTLALNDTILGPVIPAGTYLDNVVIDTGQLDSNGSPAIVFKVGFTGTTAAFITGSTVGQAGGIQAANVAGTVGYTSTTNTTLLATISTAAATAKAGTFVMKVTYTASP